MPCFINSQRNAIKMRIKIGNTSLRKGHSPSATAWRFGLALATLVYLLPGIQAQSSDVATLLLGRWELAAYSEQGVQVSKLGEPAAQAAAVYSHVAEQRRLQFWVAYSEDYEYATRDSRSSRRWVENDSLLETTRLQEVIAMPYYATFFPDSTLSAYNKEFVTGRVRNPEAWKYVLSKDGKSLAIKDTNGYGVRWHAQILHIDELRLVLFLSEEAEVVELQRAEYRFP